MESEFIMSSPLTTLRKSAPGVMLIFHWLVNAPFEKPAGWWARGTLPPLLVAYSWVTSTVMVPSLFR